MPEATKKTFKNTLNLPKTGFAMRANLVQNEPQSLKRWAKMKLYEALREQRKDAPKYVFHDGPPYANGSIHLGHMLNKVLKDFVVRTRSMEGFDVPYIPGWDCHGLPIEHKVMQERMEAQAEERDQGTEPSSDQGTANSQSDIGNPTSEIMNVRKACKKYANKYIKLQAKQMQQLLTLADYDNPYLTMVPSYEAAVLEVFADLVGKGLVYRMKKPVHWSIDNQTALAEAELEYEDREDTSVYVLFDLADASSLKLRDKVVAQLPGAPLSLMIWTTTPWTLPANLAVAVHEKYDYGLYRVKTNNHEHVAVIACDLAKPVIEAAGGEYTEPLAVLPGSELVGLKYRHPFLNDHADRPVVAADYVTLEDGTGMVHTAPGHGVEDYQTGLREGLDIYCPVQADGTFDNEAPDWLRGQSVWQGNDLVVDKLTESGHLFHANKFLHSYPHDWRSKGPVIFRATEQWFVDVNKPFEQQSGDNASSVKQRALDTTESGVKFYPEWGRNRMRGMLDTRPDWCLSRQRSWGLPIPAFFGPEEDQVLLTRASVQAVADLIREKGSDIWFVAEPKDLLERYDANSDPDAPNWIKSEIQNPTSEITKAGDIFDVWFESGSSWNAVIRQRGLARPDDAPAVTDLYLEGSDQHRGWFQLSLLPSLGVLGKPAFESVLTHGFMVDKDGKKISKSDKEQAKRIPGIDDIFKDFGADICRWWVSSLNTDNDIKVDIDYFQHAGEEYRKVRNTLRFLLSNLGDFDMGKDRQRFEDEDAGSVDAWVTGELIKLSDTVRAAYENFEFRKAHIALFNFCNDTLSADYLTAVKDRLYCDKIDAPRRRRSQSTLYRVATTLIRLLAPVMPHTADEAWQALEGENTDCVHLKEFQNVDCMRQIPVNEDWPMVMDQRDTWLKALEDYRQANDLDNPLDCGLRVPKTDSVDLSAFDATDLADLCGISRFEITDGDTIEVIDLRNEPRCERSWKRDGTVKERTYEGETCLLSDRDAEALNI